MLTPWREVFSNCQELEMSCWLMFANPPVSLLRNMLTTLKTAECTHGKINIKNKLEERRGVVVF